MIKLIEKKQQFNLKLTNNENITGYYQGVEPTFDQFKAIMMIDKPEKQAELLLNIIWPTLILGSLPLSTINQLTCQAMLLLEDNLKKNNL